MKQQQKTAEQEVGKKGEYLNEVFALLKRRSSFRFFQQKKQFNNTEIRMLNEIIIAKYEGKRLISTQLAERLGITRSAVSQIVSRLEQQGVVKRVSDEKDKKIAYIEITDEALEKYGETMRKELDYISEVIVEFGEEKFKQMCSLFNEFMEKTEKKKAENTSAQA